MITVRPATPEDAPAIREIIRESLLVSYARFLPPRLFDPLIRNDRAGELAAEPLRFTIAEVNHVPAAVMLLKDNYVDQLWTHPDFMGRGAGSALLGHAERVAAAAGFDRLTLYCFEKNVNALRFYRAKGFTIEQTSVATEYMAGEVTCFLKKRIPNA